MKCERCGQSFPSRFHFEVSGVCSDCFSSLPELEKFSLIEERGDLNPDLSNSKSALAVGQNRGIGCGLMALAPLVYAVLFVGAFMPQAWVSADSAQSHATFEEPSIFLALLAPFLTPLMVIAGSGPLVLAPLGAVFGLILLVSGRNSGVFGWLGVACYAIPVIALGIVLGLGALSAEDWPSAVLGFLFWLLVSSLPIGFLAWRIKTVCARAKEQESH